MLSGIQLWFYGTDLTDAQRATARKFVQAMAVNFLSRQSTTTSFEGTPINPIAPPSDYNVVKPGRS